MTLNEGLLHHRSHDMLALLLSRLHVCQACQAAHNGCPGTEFALHNNMKISDAARCLYTSHNQNLEGGFSMLCSSSVLVAIAT